MQPRGVQKGVQHDEGVTHCLAQERLHNSKYLGTWDANGRSSAAALARRAAHLKHVKEFNGLQASLQACKEPLAQARKKLLRHGNLALDAEQRAQLELRRLTLTLALTLALT